METFTKFLIIYFIIFTVYTLINFILLTDKTTVRGAQANDDYYIRMYIGGDNDNLKLIIAIVVSLIPIIRIMFISGLITIRKEGK